MGVGHEVRLSRVGEWETTDGTPYGPLSRVRCPGSQHCLQLAPFENGRLGQHVRNIPGPCGWVGTVIADDRHDIPRDCLIHIAPVTGTDRRRWCGRGPR